MDIKDVVIHGITEDKTKAQMANAIKHEAVVSASLSADSHFGYSVPVGASIAYDGHISPNAIGFDISCGNLALQTNMSGDILRANISAIMDDVFRNVEFGIGKKENTQCDNKLFDNDLWNLPHLSPIKQMAQAQLGTVGSGNHYVDVFTDENDLVWIGVHFGSRGFGHKMATYYLEKGGADDKDMMAEPLVFDVKSDLGAEYIEIMGLAGQYAYAGRDTVIDKVFSILQNYTDEKVERTESVHNNHNFAWLENHGGRDLWVVRKGATPAFPGQKGFVGGSMGDISVILEGVDSPEAAKSLYSTVHGAGRVLSRTQARGKINWKTGEVKSPGLISEEMMMDWVNKANVELRGAGTDESPHCYKRIEEVLGFHKDSIRILHTLTPVGVAMSSPDVKDPYKD